MASKIKTLSVLIVVLLIGTALAQDDESNEQAGAAIFNLGDILKPGDQKIPSEQQQDGDAESNEQQAAAAQMGTGNAAGGTADEDGRQLQGDGVFFGKPGKVDPKPQMTGEEDIDAESTEAGGAAMEAAAVAEQNEEEEEEANVGEQNEPEETEAPEVGEQNEEMEGEEADSEETQGGMPVMDGDEQEETPTGTGGNNPFIAINGKQPEGEQNEQNEEMEGEEADTEETQGGMPVMDGEEQEETPMGTGGNNPFIAINGKQPEGEGETVDAPEMVGGDGEGAEIGEAGDESGEDAQIGGEGGAQAAGGTTESGEQSAAIGQQGGADVESAEVADGGTFLGSDTIEGSDSDTSSVMTTSGGVLQEDVPVDNETPVDNEVPEDTEAPVDNEAPEDTESPDLKMNKLAAKAKQLSDVETTEQPAPTTPLPKEEEGGKTSEGLSDATKTRIAISVSSIGAVVLVGIIATIIGKRTQRRSHTGAA